ncbi:MAG: hypothetical protein GYA35_01965, partial [Thermoanaerobaculaceae bacterium]|nr:hypothetical protein [Thermoanaerobaculaceae bacterium]
KDLLLLGDKESAQDAHLHWYGFYDNPDIPFKLIRATKPDLSDAVKIYEGTERNYTDPTPPNPIFYYNVSD